MDYKGDIYYIEQILNGNQTAFGYLVNRHKDRAYNLAFRICGNREEAEEIAQDAFIKAYNSLNSFKRQSSFATWLYRIVFNTAVSVIRSRKKEILSLEDFPAEFSDFIETNITEDEAEKEYKRFILNFALRKLEEEDRGLITLYYFEELDADEIAEITGISKANIKVRLFRARQKMLAVIEKAEINKSTYHETQER